MSLVQLTTISPIQEHVKSGSLTKQTLVIEEFYWYDLGLFSTLIYAFPLDIRTNPLKALIEHFQSGALPLVATQLRNNHQMNTLIRNNKGAGVTPPSYPHPTPSHSAFLLALPGLGRVEPEQ